MWWCGYSRGNWKQMNAQLPTFNVQLSRTGGAGGRNSTGRGRCTTRGGGAPIRFCETNPPFCDGVCDTTCLWVEFYTVCRRFLQVGSFWKTNPKSGMFWGSLMANTAVLGCYFGAERATSMAPDKRKRVGRFVAQPRNGFGGGCRSGGGRRAADGVFTVWRWCWRVRRGNGMVGNRRLT